MDLSLDPQLVASGISADVAQKAGVRRVTSQEARSLGFVGNGYDGANLEGLAFPYRHPETGALLLTRLRPDTPINGRKYLAPIGTRNQLYLPCPTRDQLTDNRFAAIITEGEKKTLSVCTAAVDRYLVIGVAGVWNWRTSDKEKRPLPDTPGTRTVAVNSRALEDFNWVPWRGRTAYVVFDSDGAKNDDIRHAESALATHLKKLGANVRIVTLPPGENGEKQGIDDVLGKVPAIQRLAHLNKILSGGAPRRRTSSGSDHALELVYEPSSGFMDAFDEYIDVATDAPRVYRPFTALAILAAIVGRRVSVPFGATPLSLNLFVTLLGGSSFLHKTTNITIAKRFIRLVKPDIILPDDFTPERLIDVLQKNSQAFLAWPEFAGFLARSGRDYQAGSRELLMELFDAPETFRRELKSAKIEVKEPSLTILAASATSWLSEQLKGGDLRSGFLNRFCFVLAERKEKSYPIPLVPDVALRTRLEAQLCSLLDVSGEADLSQVETRYAAWYRDVEREALRAETQAEALSAFYARLSITAIKFSVLLELVTSGKLVVQPATLEEALVLVDYLRATIRRLLRGEFAPTETAKRLHRVLSVIQKYPGIKRGWLLKRTNLDAQELTRALGTLVEREDVYEEERSWWPSN